MYQFTTTTVINSNQDASTGLTPLWSAQEATATKPASMNVKRGLNFIKDNVLSISKAEYTDPKIATATLDLSKLGATEGTYRIAMYIKISGSANSYYANDLVYKGKPLYIEFVWKSGEAAATVAQRIKKMMKKFMIAVYETELIKVEVSGAVITIKGVDEYQRFERVDIEKYVKEDGTPFGNYEVIKSALANSEDPEYSADFKIEQGAEGFGTYQWVLKNLRLPTAANRMFGAVTEAEAPVIGAKYNQYVIRYKVNRGVLGNDAVGDEVTSITTHVFFVSQAVSSDFETALGKIAPTGGIEEVPATQSTTEDNPDKNKEE